MSPVVSIPPMAGSDQRGPRAASAVLDGLARTLAAAPAFKALPPSEQAALNANLTKVASFLRGQPAAVGPLAHAQAQAKPPPDPAQDTMKRLSGAPGEVNSGFRAGAMREGTQAFASLVQAVDFPQFVSSLIKGVFNAVVDATIQQMKAYGDLLSAAAKSVDQFANENITEAQARTHLADQNPHVFDVEYNDSGSRLRLKDGEADTEGVAQQYGLDNVDVDDPASEVALVNQAKLQLAGQRQQLLSTMVLMGINRIVITNGRINAKVVFDITSNDMAKRKADAAMADRKERDSGGFATVAAPWGASGGYENESHRTTVRSSVTDESESKAEMKAKLSGDVLLAFKSETLPLERMLDDNGVKLLTDRARPLPMPNAARAAPVAAAPATAAPAAAPAPAASAPTSPAPAGRTP